MIEASQSGTLNLLSNPSFTGIGGGILGFASAILLKLGDGYIKEFFEKRKQTKEKKEKLADKIMAICIEGSTCGWNTMPGSQRYIQRVAADIEAIDKETAKKLQQYLSLWCLCAIPQTAPYAVVNPTREDIETATRWQNDAQIIGEELLSVAEEWKK